MPRLPTTWESCRTESASFHNNKLWLIKRCQELVGKAELQHLSTFRPCQATDRIDMLSGMGRLGQQFVTLVSLSTGILLFSPWLLVLLVACLIPAFLGESHFAFLGYSLSRRLTPETKCWGVDLKEVPTFPEGNDRNLR